MLYTKPVHLRRLKNIWKRIRLFQYSIVLLFFVVFSVWVRLVLLRQEVNVQSKMRSGRYVTFLWRKKTLLGRLQRPTQYSEVLRHPKMSPGCQEDPCRTRATCDGIGLAQAALAKFCDCTGLGHDHMPTDLCRLVNNGPSRWSFSRCVR